jgi:hypothetical protein
VFETVKSSSSLIKVSPVVLDVFVKNSNLFGTGFDRVSQIGKSNVFVNRIEVLQSCPIVVV